MAIDKAMITTDDVSKALVYFGRIIARGTRAILLVKKRPTFLFDWLRRLCSNVTFKGP